MLNSTEEQVGYDFNSNVIEIWDRLSLILIYLISWSLLKTGSFDFSMFFIILLLKNFSKVNVFILAQTITWFGKYKTMLIKFEKMFFKLDNINLNEEINEIKICLADNEDLILHQGVNLIDSKVDLGNINKTKYDVEIDVYLNNKNVSKLKDSNIRQKIYYLNDFKIKFRTIYQNIAISNFSSVNIFNLNEVKNICVKIQYKYYKANKTWIKHTNRKRNY